MFFSLFISTENAIKMESNAQKKGKVIRQVDNYLYPRV